MKKLSIIAVMLFPISSLFLISCGDTDSSASMKSPIQQNIEPIAQKENKEIGKKEDSEGNEKDEKEDRLKSSTILVGTNSNAKSKTVDNLQAAFKGEKTASAKYAAYSKKAEEEGLHEIALLFKATSTAENIHANNHKAVLQESNVSVPATKPEYIVKSTKENLEDAIKVETYEVTTIYPEFLTIANEADNQIALISLNYAYKTEKKHKTMYEHALAALQNNTVKTLPSVLYVCPTCGNTYETKVPARCGLSMTNGEKFIKIISL